MIEWCTHLGTAHQRECLFANSVHFVLIPRIKISFFDHFNVQLCGDISMLLPYELIIVTVTFVNCCPQYLSDDSTLQRQLFNRLKPKPIGDFNI